jgi:hypothetical protein
MPLRVKSYDEPIGSTMKPLLLFLFLSAVCRAEPHLPAGTQALPSAADHGRGPLALVNLNRHVLGHARVFGGKGDDLFVAGYGGRLSGHAQEDHATVSASVPHHYSEED